MACFSKLAWIGKKVKKKCKKAILAIAFIEIGAYTQPVPGCRSPPHTLPQAVGVTFSPYNIVLISEPLLGFKRSSSDLI